MRRGKEKRMTPCFGGALKGVLHLFPHCNELNHPVVLPVAWILQEVHIIFVVIQYDNLRFLLGGSPFFNLLGEVYDGFLGAFFLWSLREVGRGTRSAFGGRSKTKRRNWRHEWMGIMKWHVIFHSSITLEIWWGWNCRTLCTKYFGWGMRTCTSPWSLFGRGALGLHWNHELGCKKLKISGNVMTLKHQWKKNQQNQKNLWPKKKQKTNKNENKKTTRAWAYLIARGPRRKKRQSRLGCTAMAREWTSRRRLSSWSNGEDNRVRARSAGQAGRFAGPTWPKRWATGPSRAEFQALAPGTPCPETDTPPRPAGGDSGLRLVAGALPKPIRTHGSACLPDVWFGPETPCQPLGGVHVALRGWLARGECKPLLQGSHARRLEIVLLPQPSPPPASHTRSFPTLFFTFVFVSKCERERRNREFESVGVVPL